MPGIILDIPGDTKVMSVPFFLHFWGYRFQILRVFTLQQWLTFTHISTFHFFFSIMLRPKTMNQFDLKLDVRNSE